MEISFVKTLVLREVVGSTSDEARALVREGREVLPLLVRARRQTAGRGRGSNAWWSDKGSLTFTIGLDPAAHGLEAEQGPRVALAAAVGVVDALTNVLPGIELGIRWPNDVEAGGRKLAGILPELLQTPFGPRLLVGIGLNARTRLDAAPPEVRRMASSVAELAQRPLEDPNLERLFVAVVERFAAAIQALASGEPSLPERWNRLDALAGRIVQVAQGPRIIRGVGSGIDPRGGLRLWSEGEMITLFGGQVLRDRPSE
jgi:BirA family biotin operon repressor/biotin-[acetyl-CoA-carboxylase] ligase